MLSQVKRTTELGPIRALIFGRQERQRRTNRK